MLYNYRAAGEWFNAPIQLAKAAIEEALVTVRKHVGRGAAGSIMLSMRVPVSLVFEVDSILKGGEGRSDFMRAAVMQELIRRKGVK